MFTYSSDLKPTKAIRNWKAAGYLPYHCGRGKLPIIIIFI